jgi:hypothetical protein
MRERSSSQKNETDKVYSHDYYKMMATADAQKELHLGFAICVYLGGEITSENVNTTFTRFEKETCILEVAVKLGLWKDTHYILSKGAIVPCVHTKLFKWRIDNSKHHLIIILLLRAVEKKYGDYAACRIVEKCISDMRGSGWSSPTENRREEIVEFFTYFCQKNIGLKYITKAYFGNGYLFYNKIAAEMYRLTIKQQKRCKKAVLTLIGCCGSRRKAQNGILRDVLPIISLYLWNTRRDKNWKKF